MSRPAGAEVTVNGQLLGLTPLVAHLSRRSGQLVRLELAGYQPFQLQLNRRVSAAAGWNALLYFAPLPIDFGTGGLFNIRPGVVAASLLPTDANRTPAMTDDPSGIALGARVRLMIQGTGQVEGVFLEQRSDSILTWPRGASRPLSVPMSSVLQAARLGPSRRRHADVGAAIGAAAGAATGVLFVGLVGALNASFGDKTAHTSDYLAGAAIFALGGALEGALVGYFIKGPRWEPVPMRRTSLQPLIGKHEVGLTVMMRR